MSRYMNTSMHNKILQELLNGLNILLVTGAFWLCWQHFYESHIIHPFYYAGNLIMVFLFGLFYYFTSHLYNGYSVPISRIYELVYSQGLDMRIKGLFGMNVFYIHITVTMIITKRKLKFRTKCYKQSVLEKSNILSLLSC